MIPQYSHKMEEMKTMRELKTLITNQEFEQHLKDIVLQLAHSSVPSCGDKMS